jgi:hypothetical protein
VTRQKKIKNLAVFDFETDPFKQGRKPLPFACGYYDGDNYVDFWGDDVVERIVDHIRGIEEPRVIYAHNGGKFDFIYMMKHFEGALKIVNGRVLVAQLGNCELRDSWGIIPEPLRRAGVKLDIAYEKMERDVREKHRPEIMKYLRQDCVTLYELVEAFHLEFGDRLTIGGTAMKEIKKRHTFEQANEQFDDSFRPFYFGGRCQVLEPGVHHGKFIMVDINSAYSHAMASIDHPIGTTYTVGKSLTKNTDFAIIEARNFGALPLRTKTGISFDAEEGIFHATIHEINAGLETSTLEIIKVHETRSFIKKGNFADFINHFQEAKVKADLAGDKIHRDFYKRVNNSGYGKFAQNATDFKDYCITRIDEPCPQPRWHPGMSEFEASNAWQPEQRCQEYIIWWKPSKQRTYYNVATAASITGATRSFWLRGCAASKRPLYGDTDSIICEEFHGEIHDTKLGAWKLEKLGLEEYGHKKAFEVATSVAIAGKKMYAMFVGDEPVKMASKGCRLTGHEILEIAQGGEVVYHNQAPTFKISGHADFVTRRLRRTAVAGRFGRESV